jgi:hypothetical protein
VRRARRRTTWALFASAVLSAGPITVPAEAEEPVVPPATAAEAEVPEVLRGDTWLRHHREDLMPYWDLPEALGDPVGNFPSFRGRNGEPLPESPIRGVSTLARQVYGYSLAFMLTGEVRYLTYAKAGLDWIDAKARDPVQGGYYEQLTADGDPVDPQDDKRVFVLGSLGMAYGMYFNATRDPAAEAALLEVRDLLFDRYYVAAENRVRDALTDDLSTEVDTGGNGGDITNLLVPGTALLLPNAALLTDPERRAQFLGDLRRLTDSLVARHKHNGAANPANRFWFWGRTARVGNLNAAQTDFGHNIKSYEMIHNANTMFADRPWDGLAADRTTLLARAWDEAAGRWNERMRSFAVGNVEPDSGWWVHDEADQTLAALDLADGFAHQAQLARSAQTFLDVYVDRDPAYPARETFSRVERTGTMNDLRKSSFGKSMLHNHEHALVMYLHGRALEERPARLHYAFPADRALTAVAKPYWFDAAGETRTVRRPLDALPGHVLVDVDFTGIGAVPRAPYPAPDDVTAPTTSVALSSAANADGWHAEPVEVALTATDDLVRVKEIHAQVRERTGSVPGTASIAPGGELRIPSLTVDGVYDVTFHAVDVLGNAEQPRTVTVRVDRAAPAVRGLPTAPCLVWPPNRRMVQVADVVGHDALSGVAAVDVAVTSNEPAEDDDDIAVVGGSVAVRAVRDGRGIGRTYTVEAVVTDRAGNATADRATCEVRHDQRPAGR